MHPNAQRCCGNRRCIGCCMHLRQRGHLLLHAPEFHSQLLDAVEPGCTSSLPCCVCVFAATRAAPTTRAATKAARAADAAAAAARVAAAAAAATVAKLARSVEPLLAAGATVPVVLLWGAGSRRGDAQILSGVGKTARWSVLAASPPHERRAHARPEKIRQVYQLAATVRKSAVITSCTDADHVELAELGAEEKIHVGSLIWPGHRRRRLSLPSTAAAANAPTAQSTDGSCTASARDASSSTAEGTRRENNSSGMAAEDTSSENTSCAALLSTAGPGGEPKC
mmetsp:Transcript_64520/g.210384  ORF Transcript_64520/g.210384 Transcript_64520/m.210384 type:complete len:282 (+) Transcript_64520:1023-1868(+)